MSEHYSSNKQHVKANVDALKYYNNNTQEVILIPNSLNKVRDTRYPNNKIESKEQIPLKTFKQLDDVFSNQNHPLSSPEHSQHGNASKSSNDGYTNYGFIEDENLPSTHQGHFTQQRTLPSTHQGHFTQQRTLPRPNQKNENQKRKLPTLTHLNTAHFIASSPRIPVPTYSNNAHFTPNQSKFPDPTYSRISNTEHFTPNQPKLPEPTYSSQSKFPDQTYSRISNTEHFTPNQSKLPDPTNSSRAHFTPNQSKTYSRISNTEHFTPNVSTSTVNYGHAKVNYSNKKANIATEIVNWIVDISNDWIPSREKLQLIYCGFLMLVWHILYVKFGPRATGGHDLNADD